MDYSCLLAYGLLGSQLLMNIIPKKKFDLKLNTEQELVYSKIKRERLHIFIKSLLGGLLISYLMRKYIKYTNEKCYYISFTLLLTNLFYLIHPKSIYLLSVLNNKEQIDKWLEYYRYMQFKSKFGILLSMMSSVLILKN